MGLIDIDAAGFARAGTNVRIFEWVRLTDAHHIRVDDNLVVDDFVFLQGGEGLRIGSYVHIAAFASITGGGKATVGNFCGIASGARILTGSDRFDGSGLIGPTVPAERRSVERSETVLEDHAFVGANAVVHPGVRIGEGAIIGSGSVVRENVSPWTINVGAPTRVVGTRQSDVILAHAAALGFSAKGTN
jgi:acetyltransferase-like isoleucine patch superfamily enzyme